TLDANQGTRQSRSDAAAVAASLLPAVEAVDATRLRELVWRAVALRGPRPNDRGESWGGWSSGLAMNLARYDRKAAAAVLEPARAEFGALDAGSYRQPYLAMEEVHVDPRRAVALIEGLPEDATVDRIERKNGARLMTAKTLGMSQSDRWKEARGLVMPLWLPQ